MKELRKLESNLKAPTLQYAEASRVQRVTSQLDGLHVSSCQEFRIMTTSKQDEHSTVFQLGPEGNAKRQLEVTLLAWVSVVVVVCSVVVQDLHT